MQSIRLYVISYNYSSDRMLITPYQVNTLLMIDITSIGAV